MTDAILAYSWSRWWSLELQTPFILKPNTYLPAHKKWIIQRITYIYIFFIITSDHQPFHHSKKKVTAGLFIFFFCKTTSISYQKKNTHLISDNLNWMAVKRTIQKKKKKWQLRDWFWSVDVSAYSHKKMDMPLDLTEFITQPRLKRFRLNSLFALMLWVNSKKVWSKRTHPITRYASFNNQSKINLWLLVKVVDWDFRLIEVAIYNNEQAVISKNLTRVEFISN